MIDEKLSLLNLSNEENEKAIGKFLVSLSLINIDELKDILELLRVNGIYITKAKELKVLANTKEEITKKLNILKELGEISLYKQDPTKINYNVIDIYKKVQYCKQIGISYKKTDGNYENFLFDEKLWQQVINRQDEVMSTSTKLKEEIVTMAPEIPSFSEDIVNSETNESVTTTFDAIQDELETQNLENNIIKLTENRKELEGFKKQLSELDTISFDDLDFGPESFGGR